MYIVQLFWLCLIVFKRHLIKTIDFIAVWFKGSPGVPTAHSSYTH